ncbi:IAA-amino acid hydrolase ILR1-like 6 [Dendrobium catenatum]|uniref:IAA-amino acid hydrolase ILR1-like 6 n=1 Tax=Dendrobium catenatum TaxID=906689 RepID=A0A2I0VFZ0_9ASPA|nr:IAA-amino acid hydrolase ILR1-like 6 [Dendrobium catenatum]
MYEHVKNVAVSLLGPKNYKDVPPMMGAEDYFYSEIVPAAFYYIGVRFVDIIQLCD